MAGVINGVMTFLVAGIFGLGGPEIVALLGLLFTVVVPVAVVVLIVKAIQVGAPFCSNCGSRLA